MMNVIFFSILRYCVDHSAVIAKGKATLAGTFLAYCYSAGPYMPLVNFAVLISLSGYPPKLRPYASNAVAAHQAFLDALQDPETGKFNLYLGSFLTLGIMLVSTYVLFRALIFVHDLHGWRMVGAILISFIIFGIIGLVMKRVSTLFMPPTPPPRPTASVPPAAVLPAPPTTSDPSPSKV
jgi:hypothetical protein